jgi:hypothetical protein
MQKNKLLILLYELDTIEQNAFIRFLNSPYHNSNQILCHLGEYLLMHIRKHNNILLDRPTIWQDCFNPEPFDDDKLRKLQSQLIKLLEQFYAFESVKNDYLALSYFTLEYASNHSKKNLLNFSVDRYHRTNKSKSLSTKNSLFSYLNENIIFKQISENSRRYSKSNLEILIELLESIFYSEYLKHVSHLKTRDWEKNDYVDSTLQFLKNRIENRTIDWSQYPGIEIYYRILETHTDFENEDNFTILRSLIKENSYLFETSEAKSMYEWLINFCVYKLNRGYMEYVHQLFDIYKEFLQNELIYEDGKLHDYNFKNIVTTGLRAKEYDWVQYFIETYADKVPEEQRANTVAYNLAQLNFYRGNFKGVLTLLQEVEYDDLTYNLGAKSMLMATYYELDELEPLYSMLDSFKVYLNRKQSIIPHDFRVLYTNLIKYIKQLISIRHGEIERIDKFISDVKKAGSVASANWLLEKAEELR